MAAPFVFSDPVASRQCCSDAQRLGLGEVVAVVVHDFVPGGGEGLDEVSGGVGAGVAFGDGAELGVGAEDEVDAGGGPLCGAGGAIAGFEQSGELEWPATGFSCRAG